MIWCRLRFWSCSFLKYSNIHRHCFSQHWQHLTPISEMPPSTIWHFLVLTKVAVLHINTLQNSISNTDPKMHMCICAYVHMHICTFAHVHFCTFAHLHIFTFSHLYICTFSHLHVCTYAHLHICTFAFFDIIFMEFCNVLIWSKATFVKTKKCQIVLWCISEIGVGCCQCWEKQGR